MSTGTKFQKVRETKAAIKQAIINKGVDVSTSDTFASYSSKIESIIDGSNFYKLVAKTITTVTAKELEGLDVISSYAFRDCSRLTSIELPSSLVSIGMYSFFNCTALTSIAIPAGVYSIAASSFSGCSALETVDFSKHTSVPTLSSYNAFNNTPDTLKILVPTALYADWIATSQWSNSVVRAKIYGVDSAGNIVNSPA